jgi:dienelactone hydrolase
MTRVGPVGRLSRTVDHAVRWRLGLIPMASAAEATAPEGGVEAFWEASRVGEPAPVTAAPLARRRAWGTTRLVDLRGSSAGPGHHAGARELFGRVAIHPSPGAPVVLLLHGYAAPNPFYEDYQMRLLLRRGMSAARLELPFHMRRRVPGRGAGSGFFSSNPAHTCAVFRQATEDAAALVAWLRQEVSPSVGVLGFSLGGLVGCLLAARVGVESLVSVTPPCDLAELTLERSPARVRRELGVVPGGGGPWGDDAVAARAALEAVLAPVTPRLLRPRTLGDRITLIAAEHDLIVGDRPVRELAESWGAECWAYGHGHVTVMTARGLSSRIRERLGRDLTLGPSPSGRGVGGSPPLRDLAG